MICASGNNRALFHIEGQTEIQLVAMHKIRVLNPSNRNKKIFARLVDSIATVGLKRPITVAETRDGYELVCGQGRFEAFQALGAKEIPCIITSISESERFLASLVENLARRRHSNKYLLEAIQILENRGYSATSIAEKTGLDASYVSNILQLLNKGEEKLINAVVSGGLSITMASKIATSGEEDVQQAMMQAYEEGTLNGGQLMQVRRLIAHRNAAGKHRAKGMSSLGKNITSKKLLRTFQTHMLRKQQLVKKKEIHENYLRFIIAGLRRVLEDEGFYHLLRAERLLDMPKVLADRVRGK